MYTPFVLPRGDRSGNSRAAASAFYFVGLLKLASFFAFCPSQIIHSVLSFLPGDDDDPYLENGFVWVVPWGTTDHASCIAYHCIVADFPELVLFYCYHLMYCVHIRNAYRSI